MDPFPTRTQGLGSASQLKVIDRSRCSSCDSFSRSNHLSASILEGEPCSKSEWLQDLNGGSNVIVEHNLCRWAPVFSMKKLLLFLGTILGSLLILSTLLVLAFNTLVALLINERKTPIIRYACGGGDLEFVDHAWSDAGGRRHKLLLLYQGKAVVTSDWPLVIPKQNTMPPNWVIKAYDPQAIPGNTIFATNLLVDPLQFSQSEFEEIVRCYEQHRQTIDQAIAAIDPNNDRLRIGSIIYADPQSLF